MNKVLFVRHATFGDCLLITPFIREFKEKYPDWKIDVYSRYNFFQFYPEVNTWINSTKTNLVDIVNLYDNVFLFCYEHSPKQHILDGYEFTSGLSLKNDFPYVPDVSQFLSRKQLSRWEKLKNRYIVFTPFAGPPSRNLAVHKVYEILNSLNHHFPEFEKVIFHHSRYYFGGAINMTDERSFPEMVYIMQNAAACVTVDTGFFHLAQACNIPTILIAGLTDPRLRITGPEACWTVEAKLSCLGCYHRHIGTFGVAFNACFRSDFACNSEFSTKDIIEKLHLAFTGNKNRESRTLRHSPHRQKEFIEFSKHGELSLYNIRRFYLTMLSKEYLKAILQRKYLMAPSKMLYRYARNCAKKIVRLTLFLKWRCSIDKIKAVK